MSRSLFVLETEVPNFRATEVQIGNLRDKDTKEINNMTETSSCYLLKCEEREREQTHVSSCDLLKCEERERESRRMCLFLSVGCILTHDLEPQLPIFLPTVSILESPSCILVVNI
jgi:hypothetical protein